MPSQAFASLRKPSQAFASRLDGCTNSDTCKFAVTDNAIRWYDVTAVSVLFFVVTLHLSAQLPESIIADDCAPPSAPLVTITPSAFHGNGMNLTSHGVLKVLIVMAQFPDDDFEPANTEWPLNPNGVPQPAPLWVQHPELLITSIDQHAPGVPFTYHPGSLSEFYYTMTKNVAESERLRVYGDVVHYVFPFTREQMRTYVEPNHTEPGMTFATGLNIVFNGTAGMPGVLLPPGRTYEAYDNWTTQAPFVHIYQPDAPTGDRYVDLVIVCWRNIARDLNVLEDIELIDYLQGKGWLRSTRAGIGADVGDIVVADGLRLQSHFFSGHVASGASIWFRDILESNPSYRSTGIRDGSFRGLVHEIGHHLLGGEHFTGGPWTMLANTDNRSYAPTAFEMAELGWIVPEIFTKDVAKNTVLSIGDLYTTGSTVAIEIDAASNQWYFLENHQMISPYDYTTAFDNIRDHGKGLYVLYHRDKEQLLQSANGAYDWTVEQVVYKREWNNANIPVFLQGATNTQTGYTRSERIHASVTQPNGQSKDIHPIILVAANNSAGYTDENYFSGKYPGDQHTYCTSGMWGPETNPASTVVNRNTQPPSVLNTGASFRIISETDGLMQVRVANDYVDIIPPAQVSSTSVPTMDVPDPVVAYSTPCTRSVLVEWSSANIGGDADHFLITGGDNNVTAPATATAAMINITVGANEGVASRWVDVFTVDASGNVSCSSGSGASLSTVISCPNNAAKAAVPTIRPQANTAEVKAVVFPQPAGDRVTVEVTGEHQLTGVITIYDAVGCLQQVPYTTAPFPTDNAMHIQLCTSALRSGLYSVQLPTSRGLHTLPLFVY